MSCDITPHIVCTSTADILEATGNFNVQTSESKSGSDVASVTPRKVLIPPDQPGGITTNENFCSDTIFNLSPVPVRLNCAKILKNWQRKTARKPAILVSILTLVKRNEWSWGALLMTAVSPSSQPIRVVSYAMVFDRHDYLANSRTQREMLCKHDLVKNGNQL